MIKVRPPTEAAALAWFNETLRQNGEDKPPLRVFRFLSPKSEYFEKNLRDAIVHSSLYLSPKKVFNDPFDTSVFCDLGTTDQQRQFLCELSVRNRDALDVNSEDFRQLAASYFGDGAFGRDIERNLGEVGICCFNPDVENLLMWAHYADAHRGVALIFNLHNDVAHFDALPVRYQKHFSRICPTANAIDDMLFYGPLHKGADWKYEKEWRIVKPLEAGGTYSFHHTLLWGVVHGMRCEERDIKLVGKLCLERIQAGMLPLHLYDARHRPGEYALDFYEAIPVRRPHPIDFKKPLPIPPKIIRGPANG